MRVALERDLVGEIFGRLEVIEKAPDRFDQRGYRRNYWVCQCECGNIVERRDDGLTSGQSKSCGCLRREQMSSKMKEIMTGRIKYGDSRERIHNIWYLMKYRCEDISSPAYERYGGRGIFICPEWSDGIDGYFCFKEWALANGYRESLSLDRIDNDGPYSPENCRWSDGYTQANNKRSNILYEINGITKTLAEWAREYDINYKALHRRLRLGWEIERALSTPLRKSQNIA